MTPTIEDILFAVLQREITKPKVKEARNVWIPGDMWRLIYMRVFARQDPAQYQLLIWRLCRAINVSLNADWRWRAEGVGREIEAILTSEPPPRKRNHGTG